MTTLRTEKYPLARLLLVGLTGGIASGKSTIAGMFAGLGAVVIDTDRIGHTLLEPGEPALAELVAHFGPRILLPDGRADRAALGAAIFHRASDRAVLNRVMHPRIGQELQKKLRLLETRAAAQCVVVVEAPVLCEAGWAPLFDKIVMVEAQPSTQAQRLTARAGLTAEQAAARIQSQWSTRRRRRFADYRVDGEAPLAVTRAEVESIWSSLQRLPTGLLSPIDPGADPPHSARGSKSGEEVRHVARKISKASKAFM